MSEQTVAERLAAATCKAAPYGWSDRTKLGNEISHFHLCKNGWSVGEVCGETARWRCDGSDLYQGGNDLVPLPAPPATPEAPERLTDEDLGRIVLEYAGSAEGNFASECLNSRREIAQLKAEIDRLTSDVDGYQKRCSELGAERIRDEATMNDIRRDRDSFWQQLQAVKKECDMAIGIARRMRAWIDVHNPHHAPGAVGLVAEFDQKYATKRDVPETNFGEPKCSHEIDVAHICRRCGTEVIDDVVGDFPFDRPGWFYCQFPDSEWPHRINTASEAITIGPEKYVDVGGAWRKVSFLRNWQRSASPGGPWEACPKGGE